MRIVAPSRPTAKPIDEPGPHRLMMFQESALFPWLTVLGNVLFGLKLSNGLSAPNAGRKQSTFWNWWDLNGSCIRMSMSCREG